MNRICPIDILKTLVAIKSISTQNNSEIVSFLDDFFSSLGFTTHRISDSAHVGRNNLLCKIGPDGPQGLMLSGHLDVVPAEGQDWTFDPFVLTERDDRLFGRGSADMKGFIAASCSAISSKDLRRLKKPLSLLWTFDEEVGCIGSAIAAPLLKNYFEQLPSAALIGEPTDFHIVRMHAGHVTVKISVKGHGAHSCDPDLGISAIKALNRGLTGLFELESALRSELILPEYFERPFVILNVGLIRGGSAVNIVPDEAHAIVGFRPLPNISADRIVTRIRSACTKYQDDERICISCAIENEAPAMITDKNNDLAKILEPLATGYGPAAQYATDGGNLNRIGISSLIFGPGSIGVAHRADEWIARSDLFAAADKISIILDRWQEL